MVASLKSLSTRISVPEGYQEIPLEWNDGTGDKLYVYINPNLTSQPVYIGSDENKLITDRQRVIQFTTTNNNSDNTLKSTASLTVIQSESVVTMDKNELYYSLNSGAEVLLATFSNTSPFEAVYPGTLPIGSSVSFKVYTYVTINGEQQKIQRSFNKSYTATRLNPSGVNLSNSVSGGILTATYTNPGSVTSVVGTQFTELTIDSMETESGYFLPGISNNSISIAGEQNIAVTTLSNLQVEYDPLVVSASGETLYPDASFEIETVYTSGWSSPSTTITYQDNPYAFTIVDSTLDDLASFSNCDLTIGMADTVYASNKERARFKIRTNWEGVSQLTSSEIAVYQGPNVPESIVSLNQNQSKLSWMVPYPEGDTEVIWFDNTAGSTLELPLPASGVSNMGFYDVNLNFNIKLTSGVSANFVLSSSAGSGFYTWTAGSGAPTVEDFSGVFDKWVLNLFRSFGSAAVPSTLITVASKGTTISDETTLGTLVLQMYNTEKSTVDWTYSNQITVKQDPNKFTTTSISNVEVEYPEIPATGGTIEPTVFNVTLSGTYDSGSTANSITVDLTEDDTYLTELDTIGGMSHCSVKMYENYGVRMFLDEIISSDPDEGDINTSGLHTSTFDSFYFVYPPSATDSPRRVYCKATSFAQDDIGIDFYHKTNDEELYYIYAKTRRAPNRYYVTSYSNVDFSSVFDEVSMPARGGDITQQIVDGFTCTVSGQFESGFSNSINLVGNKPSSSVITPVNEDGTMFSIYSFLLTPTIPSDDYTGYRVSTNILGGIKASTLTNTEKDASVNFINNISQVGLIISHTDETSTILSDIGNLVIVDQPNVPMAWEENVRHNYTDKNIPFIFYLNRLTGVYNLGVNAIQYNMVSFEWYYDFSDNICNLHIINVPKTGADIYFGVYDKVTGFMNSGYAYNQSSLLSGANLQSPTDIALVISNSALTLGSSSIEFGTSTSSYYKMDVNKLTIAANNTGSPRHFGTSDDSPGTNFYNNSSGTVGRGTVFTIYIEQLG